MTTAVDTNVLIDVLFPNSPHRGSSLTALRAAADEGAMVICEAVYAELAGYFGDAEGLQTFLNETRIRFEPSGADALITAGVAWREYTIRRRSSLICPQCGSHLEIKCENCGRELRPRQHLVADLMIGAHALLQADRLLTRDRGFYGTYFPTLKLA